MQLCRHGLSHNDLDFSEVSSLTMVGVSGEGDDESLLTKRFVYASSSSLIIICLLNSDNC